MEAMRTCDEGAAARALSARLVLVDGYRGRRFDLPSVHIPSDQDLISRTARIGNAIDEQVFDRRRAARACYDRNEFERFVIADWVKLNARLGSNRMIEYERPPFYLTDS